MELSVFIVRITICFLLSIVIGLERQYRHGSVGLRTNVLVGIGSFLFNYATYGFVGHDLSRIASSIVSGVGFLGAGMIIKNNNKIKGLNTAATIWCVASIGLLTSVGMVWEAVIGTVFVVLSNVVLRLLSFFIMDRVKKLYREKCSISIVCEKEAEIIIRGSFSNYIEKNNIRLMKFEKEEAKRDTVKLVIEVVTSRVEVIDKFVKNIGMEPGVVSVSWDHRKSYLNDNRDDSDE